MKRLVLIAVTAFLGLLLSSCSEESTPEQTSQNISTIPVKTLILQPRPFSEYLDLTGTVEARNHIQLIVEEGGILNRVIRDKGQKVNAGDTLAILDNKILEATFNEAQAAIRQADLDYDSKNILYEKRAISENEYLLSKYALDRARAAYELSRARYSKLFIVAPLSGYVNDRFYDMGAYAMPMAPIFDFIDNAYMKITAGIAERFLSDIQIGTPVKITFDAFPGDVINTTVSYVSRSIDPLSRTFKIEIRVPNSDRKLAPQMIANLKILRRSYQDQIVIPLDAVIESEEGQFVFVNAQNVAKKYQVQVRAIYEDSVLVDGLKAAEELVVVGQQELTEGDPLQIVE